MTITVIGEKICILKFLDNSMLLTDAQDDGTKFAPEVNHDIAYLYR